MRIDKVYIKRGFEDRTVDFDQKVNIIFSKENSKGKTTLLRLILYGFGYNIPATDGIKTFEDFEIRIEYENYGKKFRIERQNYNVNLYIGEEKQTYIVPEQLSELHAMIFNISDVMILDNLLAIYYIDQEKGWTLLNRGIIIGKNRFNVETFISALSDKDVSKINIELDRLNDEIKKYKYLKSIAEYKKEIEQESIGYTKSDNVELFQQKTLLDSQKHEFSRDIKEISQILCDNKKMVEYLEKLEIYIKIDNGKSIKVTKENIQNFKENQLYYEARKKELEIHLAKISNELSNVQEQIESRYALFNVKTVLEEVNNMITNVNFNENQVDRIIYQLSERKKKLTTSLRDIISTNNQYLVSIFETIRKYAIELGIQKYIKDDFNFVLTNQLKGKSGKILTQMAFIFKIAYILEIKKKYNLILPLIIDSPRTNELTDDASTAMLKILERDLYEHQVIFASVYPFEKIKKSVIEMKENLFN